MQDSLMGLGFRVRFLEGFLVRVTSQLVEEPLLREIWRLFPSFEAVALHGLGLRVQALDIN